MNACSCDGMYDSYSGTVSPVCIYSAVIYEMHVVSDMRQPYCTNRLDTAIAHDESNLSTDTYTQPAWTCKNITSFDFISFEAIAFLSIPGPLIAVYRYHYIELPVHIHP